MIRVPSCADRRKRNRHERAKRQQPSGPGRPRLRNWLVLSLLMLLELLAYAQDTKQSTRAHGDNALKVNWLYGASVPKDVPLVPLDGKQRWKLYLRSTYTTPGIYIKTGLFTTRDQIRNVPPEWEKSPAGFGKRFASLQAQFAIQNSIIAMGDAAVGWEPRYDRCRCEKFWPRTWHAVARNFVTYGGPEMSLRPQLMPYVGAFGAAVTAASWQPGDPRLLVKGYQAAVTQVGVGIGINLLAEFAPEIKRVLHRDKKKTAAITDQHP